MELKKYTFDEHFTEKSLPEFYERWGTIKSENEDFRKDYFEDKMGFLNRSYLLSALVYPVFLYLQKNDLLKFFSDYNYSEKFDYPSFLNIQILIEVTKSDKVPDYMKSSILFYLRSIEGLTYEMLDDVKTIPSEIIELHGYLQLIHCSFRNNP